MYISGMDQQADRFPGIRDLGTRSLIGLHEFPDVVRKYDDYAYGSNHGDQYGYI